MSSDVMEDYLKVIFRLEREEGAPVSTSQIADDMDVTPPTVTSMMSKLAERGLVTREKYKGVELTEEGEAIALETIRHHRLLEAYLTEHLDYEWSEVHEEADVLEHHISEVFEQRIADVLDDPPVDPHGDPIPGPDLEPFPDDETAPLSSFEAGDRLVVARVSDRDRGELKFLSESGVEPGTSIVIERVTPVGMYRIAVGDRTCHLPESVAETIRVRRESEATDADPPE
ncbi:MAG: metal-dependent transcriptional regulator, partial [Candidatus Nanohaloarchaea archaeon]